MEGLLLAIAKIAAGVAIALPLVIFLVQDKLIFFPRRLDEARRADIARRFPQAKSVLIQRATACGCTPGGRRPAGPRRGRW